MVINNLSAISHVFKTSNTPILHVFEVLAKKLGQKSSIVIAKGRFFWNRKNPSTHCKTTAYYNFGCKRTVPLQSFDEDIRKIIYTCVHIR